LVDEIRLANQRSCEYSR